MPSIEHVWCCDSPHVRLGRGHVAKFADLVVGQMHAIDARTGRLLWARPPGRPDSVAGVTDGIVIGARSPRHSPGGAPYGAYALDGGTGDRLWRLNHPNPLLDLLGEVLGSFALTVLRVHRGEVFLSDGSVLDARTGHVLRNVLRQGWGDPAGLPGLLPDADVCAAAQAFQRVGAFSFPDGSWVRRMESGLSVVPGLRCVGVHSGCPLTPDWEWRLPDPYGARPDFHGQRLLPIGIVAVIATDGREDARLFAFDIRSGWASSKRLEPAPGMQGRALEWRIEDSELAELVVSHAAADGGPGSVHLFRLHADPPPIGIEPQQDAAGAQAA